jgi:hypothetical protein
MLIGRGLFCSWRSCGYGKPALSHCFRVDECDLCLPRNCVRQTSICAFILRKFYSSSILSKCAASPSQPPPSRSSSSIITGSSSPSSPFTPSHAAPPGAPIAAGPAPSSGAALAGVPLSHRCSCRRHERTIPSHCRLLNLRHASQHSATLGATARKLTAHKCRVS